MEENMNQPFLDNTRSTYLLNESHDSSQSISSTNSKHLKNGLRTTINNSEKSTDISEYNSDGNKYTGSRCLMGI